MKLPNVAAKLALSLLLIWAGVFMIPSANANSAAAEYFRNRTQHSAVPSVLSQDERTYYRDIFTALKRQDWAKVQLMFAQKADGPLHSVARAEYFLAAGSPKVEATALTQWLQTGTQLPQAEQIAALAQKRGATGLPALPQSQYIASLPSMVKRMHPHSVADGTMPAPISAQIYARIKGDDPIGARVLLDGIDAVLSPEARAEWRQKVAWSYYIENDDRSALALAETVSQGSGPWVAEGWWTAGLASWRIGDCAAAGDAFAKTAQSADNAELSAAALYWQSRALVRCRQPELASGILRQAAARDETLYGMMAAEQLGAKLPQTHAGADLSPADWQLLRDNGNVRAAVGLAEIGEDALADDLLRHQARIGEAALYYPLTRLARDLGTPATQLWMAYNAPPGGRPDPASRYPTPKWTPVTGWKIDPALIYAHTLQESNFRASVVSPAGARGLMQLMPASARQQAAVLGLDSSRSELTKPAVNLAFGQEHLAMLRDASGTQGLLPKVMAAYNAGILPISKWNTEIHDAGDPLLWIESVPYWETRGYVNVVMKNYWMYERQAGGASESRVALVQGMWPTFPGLAGAPAVRMAANGAVIRGN